MTFGMYLRIELLTECKSKYCLDYREWFTLIINRIQNIYKVDKYKVPNIALSIDMIPYAKQANRYLETEFE